MINSLQIGGFKSIDQFEEPIELGLVNVFIGANGSGKSNILEAVGVLSAAASGSVDDRSLLGKGVRPGTPYLFKTAFGPAIRNSKRLRLAANRLELDEHTKYDVLLDNPVKALQNSWRFVDERIKVEGSLLLSRSVDGANIGKFELLKASAFIGLAAFAIAADESLSKAKKLIDALRGYAIYSPNTPVLRGTAADVEQADPVGLAGGRLAEAVGDLLRGDADKFGSIDIEDVLEMLDWVESFDIASPSRALLAGGVPSVNQIVRFTDRYMRAGRNRLTGFDASEGALYVLFALVLALHPTAPAFFAIDNFDQALNPRSARKLMSKFAQIILDAEGEKQVLLTTHNPAVLDGLDLADDNIRLFAVDRDTRGLTTVRRIIVSEETRSAFGKDTALSMLWMSGRLGGVPNL